MTFLIFLHKSWYIVLFYDIILYYILFTERLTRSIWHYVHFEYMDIRATTNNNEDTHFSPPHFSCPHHTSGHKSRPRRRPSPTMLRLSHYPSHCALPTTPYFCSSPPQQCCRPDRPEAGWLIRFFKPKSILPLLLTVPLLSQCDVNFIVARRNCFIQKFARTPSA